MLRRVNGASGASADRENEKIRAAVVRVPNCRRVLQVGGRSRIGLEKGCDVVVVDTIDEMRRYLLGKHRFDVVVCDGRDVRDNIEEIADECCARARAFLYVSRVGGLRLGGKIRACEQIEEGIFVYSFQRSRSFRMIFILLAVVVASVWYGWRKQVLPDDLEPMPGTAQCNYELLKEFSVVAEGLDWTLGAGTLLGAMRTTGLLQWEHDVDVYAPASHAFEIVQRLSIYPRNTLDWRGFVDAEGEACCGFGFKIFHRDDRASCELDVLVLAASSYAPWVHGETPTWPPWALPAAFVKDYFYSNPSPQYLVIPEDVRHKNLLGERSWWKGDVFRGGPRVSYFHKEYFEMSEFYPIRSIPFYDFHVQIPNDPWASLNRTYGPTCAFVARVDEHGGASYDLRDPRYSHLNKPAYIVTK